MKKMLMIVAATVAVGAASVAGAQLKAERPVEAKPVEALRVRGGLTQDELILRAAPEVEATRVEARTLPFAIPAYDD